MRHQLRLLHPGTQDPARTPGPGGREHAIALIITLGASSGRIAAFDIDFPGSVTMTLSALSHHYQHLLERLDADPVTPLRQPAPRTGADEPSLADTMAGPALADSLISDLAAILGSPDTRTTATQLWKRVALDILAPSMVLWLTDQRLSLPEPTAVYWSRDQQKWFADGSGQWRHYETTDAATQALGQWLEGTEQYFRGQWPVSKSGFWSSVALAAIRPYAAVRLELPAGEWRAQADAWMAMMPGPTARYLRWFEEGSSSGPRLAPQRRGCCLKFQLPGKDHCSTCGFRR